MTFPSDTVPVEQHCSTGCPLNGGVYRMPRIIMCPESGDAMSVSARCETCGQDAEIRRID